MPVETFGYVDSLNTSNPPSTDGLVEIDEHLRGIKLAIKQSFPQIAGAALVTHTQLTNLGAGNVAYAAGTSGAPSTYFSAEATLGLYRSAAGVISVVGGKLSGNGTVPTGMIGDFLQTGVPTGWYELNGQAVSRTGETAGLFSIFGTTYGTGNGTTTFNLPNFDGRFRRSRASGLTVGTFQDDAVTAHTHTGTTAASGAHTHTGTADAVGDHVHPNSVTFLQAASFGPDMLVLSNSASANPAPNTGAGGSHSHSLTIAAATSHTHTFTTNANGAETETRPKAVVVVTCVKA